MSSPCPKPGTYGSLIKQSTLEAIYQKFHAATFTVTDAVNRLYWIDCVEKHVRYMQKKGWIAGVNEVGPSKFRFVVSVEDWKFGGEVH